MKLTGKRILLLMLGALILFAIFTGLTIVSHNRLPFSKQKVFGWSIGIYMGPTPFELSDPLLVENPVISSDDVTDIDAEFVADPFMVQREGIWYMFFEVYSNETRQGDIALATSRNGTEWTYEKIVLDEDSHLSYPYVFESEGVFYMIPECFRSGFVKLYRAIDFPYTWKFEKDILEGQFVDSSILYYNETWWLFTTPRRKIPNRSLNLYFADTLAGKWTEHPESPVVRRDPKKARPGGRLLQYNGRIFRLTQNDRPRYGNSLWVFEITKLTRSAYSERNMLDVPLLQGGDQHWNRGGMHHADIHKADPDTWIGCVDGNSSKILFSF